MANVKVKEDKTVKLGKGVFGNVYEFTQKDDGTLPNLNLVGNENAILSSYARQDNDLVLSVGYCADWDAWDAKPSFGFITVKDYFLYTGEFYELPDFVSVAESEGDESRFVGQIIEEEGVLSEFVNTPTYYTSEYDESYITGGAASTAYTFTNRADYVTEFVGGNEVYNILGNKSYQQYDEDADVGCQVVDLQGNDTYNAYASVVEAYDYKGNDTYRIKGQSDASVVDITGNDKYNIKGSNVQIFDGFEGYRLKSSSSSSINSGNDTYNGIGIGLSYSIQPSTTESFIVDGSGNDKYNISQSAMSEIEDWDGNDNYNLTNVAFGYYEYDDENDEYGEWINSGGIEDYSGNDKYNIVSNATLTSSADPIGTSIYDGSGVDTYNITGGAIQISDGYQAYDFEADEYVPATDGGSDVYNLSSTVYAMVEDYYGNEKYNVSDAGMLCIEDYTGSDNYTLSNVTAAFTSGYGYINDMGGNDKYTLDNVDSLMIEDEGKSTDTYAFANSDMIRVIDDNGGDKYNISDFSTKISIMDYDGKDTYSMTDTFALAIYDGGDAGDTYNLTRVDNYIAYGERRVYLPEYGITDEGGSDKYVIKDSRGIIINDEGEGKDTYSITNVEYARVNESSSDEEEIVPHISPLLIRSSLRAVSTADVAGNAYNVADSKYVEIDDGHENSKTTYNITNTDYVSLHDEGGQDTYTLKNVREAEIDDIGGGKNTFNISNSEGVYVAASSSDLRVLAKSESANNVAGNTYNITNTNDLCVEDAIAYSKTTYNFTSVDEARIYDEIGGADTYNIKKSGEVIINEGGEDNDTYAITETEYVSVYDDGGDDKYTITGSEYIDITDDGGKDTYNIKKAEETYLYDSGTDGDVYTVDNLKGKTEIVDEGGSDKLTISGLSKGNIVYMLDYTSQGTDQNIDVFGGSLFILDKSLKSTANGYAEIYNYFSETELDAGNAVASDGCIEKIYAGSKDISDGAFDAFSTGDKIASLGAQVAGWLAENNCESVGEFLQDASSEEITNFIAYVTA